MRTKTPILNNPAARAILDYITHAHRPEGRAPTQAAIANACGLQKSHVCKLVKRLTAEGYLVKNGRRWYGTDAPNRAEIDEAKALQRARFRMLRDSRT